MNGQNLKQSRFTIALCNVLLKQIRLNPYVVALTGSWWSGLLLVIALITLAPIEANAQENKISEFGRYEGYSEPIYSGWIRTSQYVTVRDGTKLAVDIIRPTESGVPVEDPLPVIWTHHRYQRATVAPNGSIRDVAWHQPWLETLLRYGYVVAAVDVRGGGASYGTRNGPFAPEEAQDAYDITEWFAAQSWSNGKIGMYGGSYLGITQYFAASTAPPHLVAIFPEMSLFDAYSFTHPGGVFREDHATQWGDGVRRLDTNPVNPTAPVDEDIDGAMLREAQAEHQGNTDVYTFLSIPIYRDSMSNDGEMIYFTRSPATYLEQIKQSGIAVYHLSGWYDIWPKDALLWFKNMDPNNPQKIVIGPWNHTAPSGLDRITEHLRWYDFWLKNVDNGIMDEAPIHYYTMGAPEDKAWRSAWQWPLPEEEPTDYYFLAGPSGSVASANDGLLGLEAPTNPNGRDDIIVDYSTTTGGTNRWTNGYGSAFDYPDMTTNDQKGLTYTTPPLDKDIELTGHPVVHLWVTSTAADGDFFVYLEEVEESGGANPNFHSNYITEGTLRVSHRRISTPPFDYLNLPYHRSYAEDISELPAGEPVELVFDLHPTSNIFDKGHRIRITITFADQPTTQTPELSPAPMVSVYRNADYASYIVLPVIPPPTSAFDPNPEDGATINDTWAFLSWKSGEYASSHDVYFGDNYEEVNEGSEQVYRGNQTSTSFLVGLTGFDYPEGLVPGTTYYWRVDEVNEADPNSPWKGPVWSFMTKPVIPITDPELICWWKLDEGQGKMVLDWSGHGYDAPFTGDPRWVEGYDGGALNFNGSGDSVIYRLESEETWPAYTVAVWAKADVISQSTNSCVFANHMTYATDTPSMQISYDDSDNYQYHGPIDAVIGPATLGWVHLAVIGEGSNVSLYYNGELITSFNHGVGDTVFSKFAIAVNRAENNWFDGSIDDCRVYNRALSQEEIQYIMRGDPLVAWAPSPADGSNPDVDVALPLSWSAGDNASQHDVYFGTDKDSVTDADAVDATGVYRGRQAATNYTPPEGVEWGGGPITGGLTK